jgi:hypothetical protein
MGTNKITVRKITQEDYLGHREGWLVEIPNNGVWIYTEFEKARESVWKVLKLRSQRYDTGRN